MYGVLVGRAVENLRRGELLSTRNIRHAAAAFHEIEETGPQWMPPDISAWQRRTFLGYHRADGQVGSRNYWLVVPLVFCENRNVAVLKQAFEEELGFAAPQMYRRQVAELARLYRQGKSEALKTFSLGDAQRTTASPKVFQNVDGIKFLLHEGGCEQSLRAAGGLRPPSECCRRHRPEPGVPECASSHTAGRNQTPGREFQQAGSNIRTAEEPFGSRDDYSGHSRYIPGPGGGGQDHAATNAPITAHTWPEMRRVGWIFRAVCEPRYRAHCRPGGRAGWKRYSLRISLAVR